MWFLLLFLLSAEIERGLKVGTVGAKFLAIPVGARAAALSGAYVAVGDDALSCFWNPALIGRTSEGLNIEGTYTNYMLGIRHFGFAAVQNLGKGKYTRCFFAGGLHSGEMEITNLDEPFGTGEKFYYYGFVCGVGFAKWLTDRFIFGINLKVIAEGLSYRLGSWYTPLCDIGVYYETEIKNLELGASIRNFGPELRPGGKFVVEEEGEVIVTDEGDTVKRRYRAYPVYMDFRFGLAYKFFEKEGYNGKVITEIVHPNDNKERLNIGFEFNFGDMFFVRFGHRRILEGFGLYDDKGLLSFGFGVKKDVFSLGYSFSDRGLLPDVHRLDLGLKF